MPLITTRDTGVFYSKGKVVEPSGQDKQSGREKTIAYSILKAHNVSDNMDALRIKFDALASHDITYVGIVQTARASGLVEFPIPYALTNCHNTLCAVGGTINEDDHLFGLSAAKKYGGIYVPTHQAVIHQYMREMEAGCAKMILGSDSHTRYGALGCMAIGEGGGELAKQLLGHTYDVNYPEVIAVVLSGAPQKGVGPHDVALAIIREVFSRGFVKNKVLEFLGNGIKSLSMDYRIGIDVMTTETACLSSIWETDEAVREYLALHGRESEYHKLEPGEMAYYDGAIEIDLGEIQPMIALPFHPSNAFTIAELNANLKDILAETEKQAIQSLDAPGLTLGLLDKVRGGRLHVDQASIAGCAGGLFENICESADILGDSVVGSGALNLNVYPASQPIYMQLVKNGVAARLMGAGAIMRTAFCGPCFGAGDVPANCALSIRHTTRNFPHREGSKPAQGQVASVALMDARSIAATVKNGGVLTSATEIPYDSKRYAYSFDSSSYASRVYDGWKKADPTAELVKGPYIADWPQMGALPENLMLRVASVILDPVTTTDELIPSGETSSYRSNPLRMSEFTLSRKDPQYVSRAKAAQALELARQSGEAMDDSSLNRAVERAAGVCTVDLKDTGLGSFIYAKKPGDGSAREQAASCQKVLGGWANIAQEYATKRYRSNLINWGLLPFIYDGDPGVFEKDAWILIPGVRDAVAQKHGEITAYALLDAPKEIKLKLSDLTDDERAILLSGCLINFYKN